MERKHRSNREVVREHIAGPLLSWKTILAGFVIAVMAHLMLTALGAGIGGAAASGALQEGGSAESAATSTAVWVGLAALIALFCGSYFASRVSPFVTARVGAAQGTIIGALFFAFMIYGAGLTVGAAGKGLSSMATGLGKGASEVSSSPAVQSTVQRVLGDVNLRDQPKVVAQELSMYLIRGDEEGAKNYYAYQTGMARTEVDTKLATLQADFRESAREAGVGAAKAVSATGWALFGTLLFGIGSAILGGALGSRANFRNPLTDEASNRRLVAHPA